MSSAPKCRVTLLPPSQSCRPCPTLMCPDRRHRCGHPNFLKDSQRSRVCTSDTARRVQHVGRVHISRTPVCQKFTRDPALRDCQGLSTANSELVGYSLILIGRLEESKRSWDIVMGHPVYMNAYMRLFQQMSSRNCLSLDQTQRSSDKCPRNHDKLAVVR